MWPTIVTKRLLMAGHHTTDIEAMISPSDSAPLLDARSISLWTRYTHEFVEEVE